MRRLGLLAAGTLALSACALKGDVRRVAEQVRQLQAERARADSVRALSLDELLANQQRLIDSLTQLERRLVSFQGDVRTDMIEIQRQLVQVQELTGQSQQRLSEMRAELDERLRERAVVPRIGADTGAGGGRQAAPGGIEAQELYDVSLQQLRRGSHQTARVGFRRFLRDYPDHPLASAAQFFIGESWESSDADSAAAAYEDVVRRFPDSRHAPTALYRLGLLAERDGNLRAAREYYQRVIAGYPRSEEAELARTKLNPGR